MNRHILMLFALALAGCETFSANDAPPKPPLQAGISGTGAPELQVVAAAAEVIASEVFVGNYPFAADADRSSVPRSFAAASSLGSNVIKGEVAYVSQAQGLLRLSGDQTDVVLTKETLLVGPEGQVLSPTEFFALLKTGITIFVEAAQR